jgi:Rrf2 family nitric oxide-sensitive transcriptional repressor
MRLTKSLDIAVMILLHLAAGKRRSNARALSAALKYPANHVAKIIQTLSRGGYVRTHRGKGGGIELAKSPEKIFLSEILNLVEGRVRLMECIVHKKACPRSPRCRLRLKLTEVQDGIIKIFKSTSVADIVPKDFTQKDFRQGAHLKNPTAYAVLDDDRFCPRSAARSARCFSHHQTLADSEAGRKSDPIEI